MSSQDERVDVVWVWFSFKFVFLDILSSEGAIIKKETGTGDRGQLPLREEQGEVVEANLHKATWLSRWSKGGMIRPHGPV